MATRQYDFTDFTRVDVGSAFEVDIARADAFSVSVDAEEDQFDHIEVSQKGDTLIVRQDWRLLGRRRGGNRPSARITMPLLTEVRLSGASRGRVTGFDSSESFHLDLSGASHLEAELKAGDSRLDLSGASRLGGSFKVADAHLDVSGASRFEGELTVGKARLELSGASRLDLSGTASDLSLEASGASRAALDSFETDDVDVKLTGASRATINAGGRLSSHLSGASSLRWAGEPTMGDVTVTGASTLKKR